MSLLSRKWCSNCQSSECPCLEDEDDRETTEQEEDIDYEEEPVSEKELWEAENKQLDNGL